MTAPIRERFEAKYIGEPMSGCWLWTAHLDEWGYGRIGEDRSGKALHANRVSWELHRGPIPPGDCVLHRCDNPPCVNPDHLFLGSVAVNNADMVRKGRQRGARGQSNSHARLNEVEALEIKSSSEKTRILAERYGIDGSAIRKIKTGRTWKHLP